MKKILLLILVLGGMNLYGADGWFSSWWNMGDNHQQDDSANRPVSRFELIAELNRELAKPEFAHLNEQERKAFLDAGLKEIEGRYANGYAWLIGQAAVKAVTALARPKAMVSIGLGACIAFAGWHTFSVTANVAKHYLLIPPLAQKTSIQSWTGWVKDQFIYEEEDMPKRSDVVFDALLAAQAEVLTKSIMSAAENDTYFRHCMLYGPPGTGKTMLAMAIAAEAGLEYIYISGSDLDKYSLEEGIRQIIHLFEYAKGYSKKLMIIIDEADALFSSRQNCSDKTRSFLAKILAYMGTEQNNFVVMTLSNRPQDYDTAALKRFGAKIKVGKPGFDERRRMFEQYTKKYLIDAHTLERDNRNFLQWFLSKKPIERMPLTLADDVLTPETFNELAQKSKNLVGRDISDIMIAVQQAGYASPDQTVTKDMIIASLELKKHQENEMVSYSEDLEVANS